MGYLAVEVYAVHPRAVAVAAFLYYVSRSVRARFLKDKHIVELCVERFHEQVCLPVPEAERAVCRRAETVGTLRLQPFGKPDEHTLASDGGHVEVFVVSLRSAESC